MKLKKAGSLLKGQTAFFDALAALILVLLIFSFGLNLASVSAERFELARSTAVKEMKLVSLADRFVKTELALEDSKNTFANKLDLNKMKNLNLDFWKQKTGFSELKVSVESESHSYSKGTGDYCVNRLVLVEGEVGVFKTCA